MKKLFLTLMFVVATSISGFAQSEKSAFESWFTKITEIVKGEPKGTTYGIVEKTSEYYLVNTPIGKYKVTRKNGGFEFMGVWAKIESKKGSVYVIKSTLGRFKIDLNKGQIIKL